MDVNKGIFNNSDNKISDKEWYEFYDAILEPFQSCDHDMDFTLSTEELAGCLESTNFKLSNKRYQFQKYQIRSGYSREDPGALPLYGQELSQFNWFPVAEKTELRLGHLLQRN